MFLFNVVNMHVYLCRSRASLIMPPKKGKSGGSKGAAKGKLQLQADRAYICMILVELNESH